MRVYYAIADGGGTKTLFQLLDENGSAAAEVTLPGSNPAAIGVNDSINILREGIESLARTAGISADQICRGAFFVPVLWRIEGCIEGVFPFSAEVLSDTEAAMWAVLGPRDGIIALSGTGSFVRGRFQGQQALTGGWGAAIGDGGSGYAIGLAALRYAARCFDEGRREDELLQRVESAFKIKSMEQLKVLQAKKGFLTPARVASLCPVVADLASQGEAAALEIVEKAAEKLTDQAVICAERLGLSRDSVFPLGLTGGVVRNAPLVWSLFRRTLGERFKNAEIFLSHREPIDGAADYIRSLIH